MTHISCPLCNSENNYLFMKIKFREVENYFKIFKCRECFLLFHHPPYKENELETMYEKNYYFFRRDESVEFKRIVKVYKRIFYKLSLNKNVKIIEIGCGKGYLLYLLKMLGYNTEGIEISSHATEYAREKFGLYVFNGTIEEYANYRSKKFDLILLIDLLEHIRNPHSFMESIKKISKKGTILVIDTPNSDSQNVKIDREKWSGFNPFHIRIYNLKSIKTLLERYGFKIIDYFYYGNYKRSILKERFREFLLIFNLLTIWDKSKIYIKNIFNKDRDIDKLISSLIDEVRNNEFVSFEGDNNLLVYAEKV